MTSVTNRFNLQISGESSVSGQYEKIDNSFNSLMLMGWATSPDITVKLYQSIDAASDQLSDSFTWSSNGFFKRVSVKGSYAKVELENNSASAIDVVFALKYSSQDVNETNNTGLAQETTLGSVQTACEAVQTAVEGELVVAVENRGTAYNILNNATFGFGNSSSLDVSTYAAGTFYYEDTSTGSMDQIDLEFSPDGTRWYKDNTNQPSLSLGASFRTACKQYDLRGVQQIRVVNKSADTNYLNAYCTMLGSSN